MTLRELLGDGPDVDVAALAYDNRAVVPGTLFFCVPGFTRDGHDFAPDAVARGAAALVVQRPLGLGVPEVLVDDVRAAMARAAARLLRRSDGRAARSSASPARAARRRRPTSCASCSRPRGGRAGCSAASRRSSAATSGRPCGRRRRRSTSRRRSARCSTRGDRACAMEVSSHALELRRADGVRFAVAAFTNLSQDHLDFHPDMEAYFAAKERLFTEFDVGRRGSSSSTTTWGRRLAAALPDAVTVSLEGPADWQARRPSAPGSAATRSPCARRPARRRSSCRCAGRFNAANALVALAAGDALGVGARRARAGRSRTSRRCRAACRRSTRGRASRVLVDYAHKPGALEKVLASAREVATGRVIVRLRRRRRPRPRRSAR